MNNQNDLYIKNYYKSNTNKQCLKFKLKNECKRNSNCITQITYMQSDAYKNINNYNFKKSVLSNNLNNKINISCKIKHPSTNKDRSYINKYLETKQNAIYRKNK